MNNENEKFYFTVGQLIEILKTMPQDLPVLTNGYEGGYENIYQPTIMTMTHQPENPYYDGQFQSVRDIGLPVRDTQTGDNEKTFKAVVLQREFRDD